MNWPSAMPAIADEVSADVAPPLEITPRDRLTVAAGSGRPGEPDARSPEALWRRRARPDRVHAPCRPRGPERLRSAGDLDRRRSAPL